MAKIHLCINVDPEIRQWFKEHDISPSQFFHEAWGQYIDGDIDTKTKIILGRIESIDQERKRLDEELHKCTGKRFEQLVQTGSKVLGLKDKEQQALDGLYGAMSEDQRKVLHGRKTWSGVTAGQLTNWVDARKADFGLLLPTQMILQRLRDNGDKGASDVSATDG